MTTITPPDITVQPTLCTCCQLPVTHTGRWAWVVVFAGKAANLCPDCAQLSPTDRAIKRMQTKQAANRAKRTAAPTVWTKATYEQYLKSAHWLQFKAEYSLRHKRKCMTCGVDGRAVQIDLHHNNYERLGGEYQDDVVYLCRDCHSLFHGKLAY